jgi:hypothetical protein
MAQGTLGQQGRLLDISSSLYSQSLKPISTAHAFLNPGGLTPEVNFGAKLETILDDISQLH